MKSGQTFGWGGFLSAPNPPLVQLNRWRSSFLSPPPHLCQAVYPHWETDGGAEDVPERLMRRAPLRAAKKLHHRQEPSAGLCGQARN